MARAGRALHGRRPGPARPRALGEAARRLLAGRLRQRRARPARRCSATSAGPSSATRSAAGSRCSSPTSSPSTASAWCSSPAAAWARRSTRCCGPAALPGAELVLPLIAPGWAIGARAGGRRVPASGSAARPAPTSPRRRAATPRWPTARRASAFLHTLRAVIDLEGQRVSATDRLYLAERHPDAADLGHARPDHPGRARARGPTADPRQPPGRVPRGRALAPARRPGSLRRRAERASSRPPSPTSSISSTCARCWVAVRRARVAKRCRRLSPAA